MTILLIANTTSEGLNAQGFTIMSLSLLLVTLLSVFCVYKLYKNKQ